MIKMCLQLIFKLICYLLALSNNKFVYVLSFVNLNGVFLRYTRCHSYTQ